MEAGEDWLVLARAGLGLFVVADRFLFLFCLVSGWRHPLPLTLTPAALTFGVVVSLRQLMQPRAELPALAAKLPDSY